MPSNLLRRRPRFALARLATCALAASLLVGCRGCDDGAKPADPKAAAKKAADEKKKKDEEEKPDFEISRITPLLSETLIDAEEGQAAALAKPGHWTAAAQMVKANAADLEATSSVEVLDAKGNPRPLTDTPYTFISSRPAVLAKGQQKRLETEVFIPDDVERFQVGARLVRAVTGYPVGDTPAPVAWRAMPSYQYFFVVLAEEPAQYSFLKVTDTIRAPRETDSGRFALHYRVVLADGSKLPPLPGSALEWTSVAHLWWDGADPDRLSAEQQTALVDWLHWGGRLVINGPDSLDTLKGSFLGPYLPAEAGKAKEYADADFAALNAAWTRREVSDNAVPALKATKPWSGIALKLHADAKRIPGTGELFAERSVGLGSVVASAVQLGQRDLINWPGYDSLLNGVLLRRPSRVFREQQGEFFTGLEVDWREYKQRQLDAYFTTPLRWFARDAGARANTVERTIAAGPQGPAYAYATGMEEVQTVVDRRGGLGAWNNFGLAADAARGALRKAAGVTVPGAGFVVACLAIYLIALVPLNWMVFHALRRVEWAWIAAPMIALAGAAAVINQAQLDIGFVSSQTEISLLEVQGDHPRGHLSRYAGLYTSLSTTYDLDYAEPTAVAAPFPGAADVDESRTPMLEAGGSVALEKYAETHLRGLAVASSTTRLVHSEELMPLKGPVRLTTSQTGLRQIENRSGISLVDAMLVRRSFGRNGKPTFEGCWIGELRSGTSTVASFTPLSVEGAAGAFKSERDASRRQAETAGRRRLDVDELIRAALRFPPPTDPLYGARDETRLVARYDGVLPGAVANPAASQQAGAVVIVAHVAYGPLPAPQPDGNSRLDLKPSAEPPPTDETPIETFDGADSIGP